MLAEALLAANALLVIAVVVGFYKAWNIGANDVANGMGTVVGAKTLTLRQAICLASVFEFTGAFLVGSHVTKTIESGIVPISLFVADPMMFGVGMLSVALASAIWLNIATLMSHPVSVTQSTIGGIVGFAMVCALGGPGSIHWAKLGTVAITWVTSPLAGGIGAFVIYKCIVRYILKSSHPVHRAKHVVPVGFAATLSIIFLAITYKGLARVTIDRPLYQLLGITACIAVVSYTVVRIVILIRTRGKTLESQEGGYEVVERWFGRLQVMTACYMSFAHGANDVASAIGPLAGSMQAFKCVLNPEMHLNPEVPVDPWLLAFGGAGIVIGLATLGYKVIIAVGQKITEITATRGFSAEFATASTVLVCSKLGLPISTTFVMVGAIMGVGLARGFAALDLKRIRHIFTSWVFTIPVSAFLTAAIYLLIRSLGIA